MEYRTPPICHPRPGWALIRMVSLLALICLLGAVTRAGAASADPVPVGVPGSWSLRLNEEFTASGLNTSLWTSGQIDGGPEMSGECIAPQRVTQPGDGYLHLSLAAETSCLGQNITGGLVQSDPANGHTGFTYTEGYAEWRAFSPAAQNGELADWPGLWSRGISGGALEIDTLEGIHGKAEFHFHWNPEKFQEGGPPPHQGYAGGWHTYGVDWEHGVLTFYYDGTMVGQLANPRIGQHTEPQYLIMDLVAPGAYGGPLAYGEMKVDYVRVWQHPAPPTATTEAATEITPTTAQLNGSVDPDGADTHYYFEYGPTTSYGNTIPASPGMDLGSGTSPIHTWNVIGGLQPGTTYHYRVVASNVAGTPESADRTFTTGKPEFAESAKWTFWRSSAAPLQLADVNGDGRADLVGYEPATGAVQVALSTGSGFAESAKWTEWSPAYPFQLADVNGDGRADLVGYNAEKHDVQVGLSTGGGFAPSTKWTEWSPAYPFTLADVNGDGRADLVGYNAAKGEVQVGLSEW